MAIVTFYRGHPNPPKTTMPAHLGANAIITCKGKLLLEKRRDSDTWGLPGGGVKKQETELQAITREIYEELGLRIPEDISIMSLDDLLISQYVEPPLSTMTFPKVDDDQRAAAFNRGNHFRRLFHAVTV